MSDKPTGPMTDEDFERIASSMFLGLEPNDRNAFACALLAEAGKRVIAGGTTIAFRGYEYVKADIIRRILGVKHV